MHNLELIRPPPEYIYVHTLSSGSDDALYDAWFNQLAVGLQELYFKWHLIYKIDCSFT